ncbi:MAG: hypothetical protein ACRC6X_08870 [Culicoidibacterales bacterium]
MYVRYNNSGGCLYGIIICLVLFLVVSLFFKIIVFLFPLIALLLLLYIGFRVVKSIFFKGRNAAGVESENLRSQKEQTFTGEAIDVEYRVVDEQQDTEN